MVTLEKTPKFGAPQEICIGVGERKGMTSTTSQTKKI